MRLQVEFCGISLKNPLIAGSCDFSRSLPQFRKTVQSGVGGIVMKSVTDVEALQDPKITRFLCLNPEMEPWKAGEKVGAFYSRGGAMLSLEAWKRIVDGQMRMADEQGVLLIGSICATSLENWRQIAKIMEAAGLRAIELNLGNPHYAASAKPMGAGILQKGGALAEVIEAVTRSVSIPVIAKLTPQVSDIVETACIAAQAGAAAVTISHRFQGMIIDIRKGEPLSSSLYGYGGPWMVPIAVGYVAKVAKETRIPICGSGGIENAGAVLQFLMAGAGAVQITTAVMLRGLRLIPSILNDLRSFCDRNGKTELKNWIGTALGKTGPYDRLSAQARVRVNNISLCRKCADRPCIDACYFDAIRTVETGVIEITEDCTACGLCLQICPYPGALHPVA
jgi:dihydroorotate dehydrogenase subfamily 1